MRIQSLKGATFEAGPRRPRSRNSLERDRSDFLRRPVLRRALPSQEREHLQTGEERESNDFRHSQRPAEFDERRRVARTLAGYEAGQDPDTDRRIIVREKKRNSASIENSGPPNSEVGLVSVDIGPAAPAESGAAFRRLFHGRCAADLPSLWAATVCRANPQLSSWSGEYRYVCLDDPCGYVMRGWRRMLEHSQETASYMLSLDPTTGEMGSLAVWFKDALEGRHHRRRR